MSGVYDLSEIDIVIPLVRMIGRVWYGSRMILGGCFVNIGRDIVTREFGRWVWGLGTAVLIGYWMRVLTCRTGSKNRWIGIISQRRIFQFYV